MDDVDWIQFYKNFSHYEGLKGVNMKDVEVFREEMTRTWSRLAQSQGLENAIKSLRDSQLLEVLIPSVVSWDNLIDRLDKRNCSESITLGQVIKWFSLVQAVLCVLFLFPCLWPILQKYCVCQVVSKGKNKYLYVNRSPELGGQLPPTVNEIGTPLIMDDAKSEQYVTSYMILHVKSIAADWLPNNFKAKVIRESKELRASKELFENFCMRLRKYEDEYQAAVRRHLEEKAKRRAQCEESRISKFGRWCSEGLRSLLIRKPGQSERRSTATCEKATGKRHLRRTYSAIPAQEYEKEHGAPRSFRGAGWARIFVSGAIITPSQPTSSFSHLATYSEMINMHLMPATPQPSTSEVKESASLFNLR